MFFSSLDDIPTKITQHKLQYNHQKIAEIKNIIAISSGKHGVGKSTIAVNIAVTLAQIGSKVGLLDAELNNSNIFKLLGLEAPSVNVVAKIKGDRFEPVSNFGVKLISLASLIDRDPLEDWCDDWCDYWLNQSIKQVLECGQWGDLDYLIVNLPPGIGDVQLALTQALPVNGVVMIATAQQQTHADIYETLKLLQKLQVPLLGLVENMGKEIAPDRFKRKYEIKGGETLTSTIRVPYLGYIPLDPSVPKYGDRGLPIVLAEPLSVFTAALNTVVWAISSQITIAALKS